MQSRDRINGSPHAEACANIGSHGTANNSSPSGLIRPATSERKVGVVPLYLIPRLVATEINRCGWRLREIRVFRTNCHYYSITVVQTEQEAAGND